MICFIVSMTALWLVVYQDKGMYTSYEHCKQLEKLLMIMSAIVSERTLNRLILTSQFSPLIALSRPIILSDIR